MVVISQETDAYNWSFYFNESNSGVRGDFPSFSNDTKQGPATFPTWNRVSLLYLYLNQSHSPLASNTSPLSLLPNRWGSCLWPWFLFQCLASVHCMPPPLLYKRIQQSVCEGKMFISRGLGDGVIIRVRLHVWSILAFCTSINISHLDVLLMAKSYSGMLLCSYFNVLGVSILHTDIHWHIFKCRIASFIILNDLSQWKDTPFVCSTVNWNGNG